MKHYSLLLRVAYIQREVRVLVAAESQQVIRQQLLTAFIRLCEVHIFILVHETDTRYVQRRQKQAQLLLVKISNFHTQFS